MTRRGRPGRMGVTVIDVVMVVGAVGVVVPLLLPVLRDADRQAGVNQCLANLHAVMRGTTLYLQENEGNFPLTNPSGDIVCTWLYGGKTSSDYWLGYTGGLFYFRADQRPLNRYVLGGPVEPDVVQGTTVVKRTEVRPFQCPADRDSFQRGFQSGPWGGVSSYDDVGTSFHFNMLALTNLNWNGSTNPWSVPGSWNDRVRLLVHDVTTRYADTFTFLLEAPMDWALGNPMNKLIQTVGNHGDFSKHSAGYLDGHADYIFRDTRRWCGPGWEAINRSWIRFYPSTPKPAYYTPTTKNCNP